MYKLPPNGLYRLRILADGSARAYHVTSHMRRLEVLGLIEAVAGENAATECAECRIALAGLAELAERQRAPRE